MNRCIVNLAKKICVLISKKNSNYTKCFTGSLYFYFTLKSKLLLTDYYILKSFPWIWALYFLIVPLQETKAANASCTMFLMDQEILKPNNSSRVELHLVTTDSDKQKVREIFEIFRGEYFSITPMTNKEIDEVTRKHTQNSYEDLYSSVSIWKGIYLGDKLVGSFRIDYFIEDKSMSIAYAIHSKYQGQGLATEAAYSTIQFMLKNFDLTQIFAIVHQLNLPSIRVLKKLGFRRGSSLPAEEEKDFFYYILIPKSFSSLTNPANNFKSKFGKILRFF